MSRMGLVAYTQVLGFIKRTPATHLAIAKEFGRGVQKIRELMFRMCHLNLAHVCDWQERQSHQGMKIPVFAYGPGESVPYPVKPRSVSQQKKPRRGDVSPELIGLAVVFDILKDGETTGALHEATKIGRGNLAPLLVEMKRQGLARVVSWEKAESGFGPFIAVVGLGQGPDAKKPAAKSRQRIDRDRRQRKRDQTRTLKMIHATAGAANADLLECAA